VTDYLLDTDIAIELLRDRNLRVASILASKSREQVLLSTVTVAELMFGALRSREPERSMSYAGNSVLRSSSRGWIMLRPSNPALYGRTWNHEDNGSAHMTC